MRKRIVALLLIIIITALLTWQAGRYFQMRKVQTVLVDQANLVCGIAEHCIESQNQQKLMTLKKETFRMVTIMEFYVNNSGNGHAHIDDGYIDVSYDNIHIIVRLKDITSDFLTRISESDGSGTIKPLWVSESYLYSSITEYISALAKIAF